MMKIIILITSLCLTAAFLAAQMRYQDNDDGTVTDIATGLVWQKCSRGQNAFDCSGTATTANWQTALQYCRNLALAERQWRLPSVNELGSIVDYTVFNPSINTGIFPGTQAEFYWSSSTYVITPGNAWLVYFYLGNVQNTGKGSSNFVRCVADGP